MPANFVIMEMEDVAQILIFFGRPFIDNVGAIIDVEKGNLTFEVGDEKIEFILSKLMKNPYIEDSCCKVDVINDCVREYSSDPYSIDKLVARMIGSANLENDEAGACRKLLDKYSSTKNQSFELFMS